MSLKFDDAFIKRFARTPKKGEREMPILFFHRLDSKTGGIEQQGYIFRLDKRGNGCGRTLDWVFGEADDDHFLFTPAFLEECIFYTTDHDMFAAYTRDRDTWPRTSPLRRLLNKAAV